MAKSLRFHIADNGNSRLIAFFVIKHLGKTLLYCPKPTEISKENLLEKMAEGLRRHIVHHRHGRLAVFLIIEHLEKYRRCCS